MISKLFKQYNSISQPMMVYSYAVDEDIFDDLLPTNNEDADHFSSMELPTAKTRASKREAGPFLNLIMDILETFYTSTKADSKRSRLKESRYTR